MNKEEYYGVFDYKESDTFRPTLAQRIHKDYPYAKTLCTRSDSCCVMLKYSGGGKNLMDKKLTIRKLTPRECGRLMGVKDEDIDLILEVLNDRQAYSVFGDSIVTTCIMSIMAQFYGIDYKEKVKPDEWWHNE